MDEILSRTTCSSTTSSTRGHYDLWIGDEAWEVDYFLHENPEEKRAAYVWMTDFVGYLPMADGGAHEAFLTADYNAEMIEQIERFPRLRDRAIFVGNPDDIVPRHFGPDLPAIRAWTEQHFDFSGYITGFDPRRVRRPRRRCAHELGYRPDEQVCIVTVGGSGVGGASAAPRHRRLPGGEAPRARAAHDRRRRAAHRPSEFAPAEGLEVRAYVHELYRHLAACDLAVVQGNTL